MSGNPIPQAAPAAPAVSRALYVPQACTEASAVVYGVGHAGAGAASWKPVAAGLGPAAEIRAYRLPGRDNRLREPPHASVQAAAAELAAAVVERWREDGRPYLIAGICSGALIGRVALSVIASAAPDAAAGALGLLAVDQPAPGAPEPPLSGLPTAELRRWLDEHGDTPSRVLGDDRLFAFFEPALRGDLRMAEDYTHRLEPLDVPLLLVRAAGQSEADIDLAGWRQDAAGPVHVLGAVAPGGLLATRPDDLADVLGAALAAVGQVAVGSPPPSSPGRPAW
ncbi:hypothetical protein KGQ19_09800 [Catenulispora sp. NL8]|uniref:Thioesterase domain-containing protein n=1 Tax=Catenulispora pinistramenti TaxID=2705254 RepID=A0ABS5KMC6_9ACTN|nr:thioesterase domain-containing protein [Catenulispora pinistramenti]MBS2547165.1 hypothetical protein [Catenulispora pinistramenti]